MKNITVLIYKSRISFIGNFTTEEMWCVLNQLKAEYEIYNRCLRKGTIILL